MGTDPGCTARISDAEIHVCTLCPQGETLAQAMAPAAAELSCTLLRFQCLGGCARRTRASIAAPGRWGWMFGGLSPADAAALTDFIRLWLAAPDGLVLKDDHPPQLQDKLLGRMPPCASSSAQAPPGMQRPRPKTVHKGETR
ncbi:MAG: DUF1636 family protein [Paracoccaceae bacterium]